jgi:voltage-gated sodium channel type II alpha
LNLFLALLLSNFGSNSLSAPTTDTETNKIAEAFERIRKFRAWAKKSIINVAKNNKAKLTNRISMMPGKSFFLKMAPSQQLHICILGGLNTDGYKNNSSLDVAIGDGMEFAINGEHANNAFFQNIHVFSAGYSQNGKRDILANGMRPSKTSMNNLGNSMR